MELHTPFVESKFNHFDFESEVKPFLDVIWNNERTSMAFNLLIVLTVPFIMTAIIMIFIEIKVKSSLF